MRASFSRGLTRCLCDGSGGGEAPSEQPLAPGPLGWGGLGLGEEPWLDPCSEEKRSVEERSELALAYPSVMAMQSHAPSFSISGAAESFFRARQRSKFAATRAVE